MTLMLRQSKLGICSAVLLVWIIVVIPELRAQQGFLPKEIFSTADFQGRPSIAVKPFLMPSVFGYDAEPLVTFQAFVTEEFATALRKTKLFADVQIVKGSATPTTDLVFAGEVTVLEEPLKRQRWDTGLRPDFRPEIWALIKLKADINRSADGRIVYRLMEIKCCRPEGQHELEYAPFAGTLCTLCSKKRVVRQVAEYLVDLIAKDLKKALEP